MVGIYKFENKYTGEMYIGQSKDIHKRYLQHKNRYDCYGKKSKPQEDTYFHSMLRHYGFHNFIFDIVEECTQDELNSKEMFYIEKYGTLYPGGYNLTKGGNFPHTNSLESIDDVRRIQDMLSVSTLSNIEIGNIFHITDQTVSDINNGRIWFDDSIKYPIRDRTQNRSVRKEVCLKCGAGITHGTKTCLCRKCYEAERSKRPSKDILYNLLLTNSFTAVGSMYGVSGNAVSKWCDKCGIPNKAHDYIVNNNEKNTEDKTHFVVIKPNIHMISNSGNIISTFHNSYDAARHIMSDNDNRSISCVASHIIEVCIGKRNTAYGYKWAYEKS